MSEVLRFIDWLPASLTSPIGAAPSWGSAGNGSLHQQQRGLSSIDSKVQAQIMERCEELHASLIQPLNDKTAGPLEKANTGGVSSTKMPFVFVLGNHSSGKSSFINYVLGRSIQTAGVAPTDDRLWYTVVPVFYSHARVELYIFTFSVSGTQ